MASVSPGGKARSQVTTNVGAYEATTGPTADEAPADTSGADLGGGIDGAAGGGLGSASSGGPIPPIGCPPAPDNVILDLV